MPYSQCRKTFLSCCGQPIVADCMGCSNSKEVGGENGKISEREEQIMRNAAAKIIKQHKRKKSTQAAQDAILWKMFCELDTQDEAETLELAVFMQTLLELVHSADSEGTPSSGSSSTEATGVDASAISLDIDTEDYPGIVINIFTKCGTF